jgi:pimeloyl-ACP methyl ester carboxylesterase
LIGIGVFILLFVGGSFLFVHIAYSSFFTRQAFADISDDLRYADISNACTRTSLTFPSGNNTLQAYLYTAPLSEQKQKIRGLVVMCPGFGSEGEESCLPKIVWLLNQGWVVFCYDDTGVHASGGTSMVGLAQSRDDLDAALDFIQEQSALNSLPLVLFGHSWGAYAAATVLAGNTRHISAVVCASGYDTPVAELSYIVRTHAGGFLATIEYPFICCYNWMVGGTDSNQSAVAAINSSTVPVLVVQGGDDDVVGADDPAIYAHRAEITNPNVRYVYLDTPGQDGHSTIFESLGASQYRTQIANQQASAAAALGYSSLASAPADVQQQLVSTVNKALYNGLNLPLFKRIEAFYEQNLKKTATSR